MDWKPQWQIDLAAEKLIAATKENTEIAVEIKTFLKASFSNEFHAVLGQYLNYLSALKRSDKNRILYLAVPSHIWNTKFQIEGIKISIQDYNVKILIYNIKTKKIEQWIV